METAFIINDRQGQYVLIPQSYHSDVDEVCINKVGNILLIVPKSSLSDAFDAGAAMLSDDFLADGMPESIPSHKESTNQ